jgi:hypothetical protein
MDLNTKIMIALGVCLAISEGLSLIPAVKSNGIFQLIYNILKSTQTPPKA